MKETDLALISAAVYAYLNSEVQIAEDRKEAYKPNNLRFTQKRNKWKWSFFPRQNTNPAILRDNWLITSRWD